MLRMRTHISILLIVATCLWTLGCENSKKCQSVTVKSPGKIDTIIGTSYLKAGEQVALMVGIQNPDSLCVQGVEVSSHYREKSNVWLLTGALIHTADNQQCSCLDDSVIYTQFYFQPDIEGVFMILYDTTLEVTTTSGSDGKYFVIKVE